MVKYECFRCGYTNNIKSRFIKHLNRKFICKPIKEDLEIIEVQTVTYFGEDDIVRFEDRYGRIAENKNNE